MTHYFGVFIVAAEGLWLFVALRAHRRFVALVGTQLVLLEVALLPVLFARRATNAAYIADIGLTERFVDVPRAFLVGISPPLQHLALPLGILVVAALAALTVLGQPNERRAGLTAAGVGAIALILSLALGTDFFIAKNEMGVWFPLMATVALALAIRRTGRAGLSGCAVICALSIAVVVMVQSDETLQKPPWREAAAAIGAGQGSDRLLVVPSSGVNGPSALGAYLADEGAPVDEQVGPFYFPDGVLAGPQVIDAPRDVVMLAYDALSGRRMCWSGAACNVPAVAVPPGYREVERRRVGLFTLLRFRADEPQQVDRVPLGQVRTLDGAPFPHALLLLQRGRAQR